VTLPLEETSSVDFKVLPLESQPPVIQRKSSPWIVTVAAAPNHLAFFRPPPKSDHWPLFDSLWQLFVALLALRVDVPPPQIKSWLFSNPPMAFCISVG